MSGADLAESPGPTHPIVLFLAALAVGAGPLVATLQADFTGVMILGLLLALAALVWLVFEWQRAGGGGGAVFHATGVTLPLCAFLIVMAISALSAEYLRPGLISLYLWFCAAALFIALSQILRGSEERRLLCVVLLASAAVAALHGIHQKYVDIPQAQKLFLSDPTNMMRLVGLPENLRNDMIGRLGIGAAIRVYSTFLQPNTLAGFLVLVIPVLLGFSIDGLRGANRRWVRRLAFGANVAALGGMLWCLYLTRSKGGALALGVGLVLLGAYCVWRLVRHLNRRYAGWATAFRIAAMSLIMLLAAANVGLRAALVAPPFGEVVSSFAVRQSYWRACVKMVEERPVFGVGPASFADYYMKYKTPRDQEADQAHNDYVQTAAEMGLAGLAVYLWLWVAFFRRATRRSEPAPPEGPAVRSPPAPGTLKPTTALIIAWAAGVAIFGIEMRFGATLGTSKTYWVWPAVLWLCWSGFALINLLLGRVDRYDFTRAGVIAGAGAFLAHSAFDFDLQVPGLRQSLVAVVALGVALAPAGKRVIRLRRAVIAPLAVGMAALLLFLWLGFAWPMTRAAADFEAARRIRDGVAKGTWQDQIFMMQRAEKEDPLNAEFPGVLADLNLSLATQQTRGEALAAIRRSLRYAQRSLKLNPARALNYTRVARCYDVLRQLARPGSPEATTHLEAALDNYNKAAAYFPSGPKIPLELGRLYEAAGDRQRALEKYRLAQELDFNQYTGPVKHLTQEERDEISRRIAALEAQRPS